VKSRSQAVKLFNINGDREMKMIKLTTYHPYVSKPVRDLWLNKYHVSSVQVAIKEVADGKNGSHVVVGEQTYVVMESVEQVLELLEDDE